MRVPFDEVSDSQIRDAEIIHVMDPADRSFHLFIPSRHRPATAAGESVPSATTLNVAIERAKVDEQVAELRRRVQAIHGDPG